MNLLHGRKPCTLDANPCRNDLTRVETDNARKSLVTARLRRTRRARASMGREVACGLPCS